MRPATRTAAIALAAIVAIGTCPPATASPRVAPTPPHRAADPAKPLHQLRGMWVATVANLNWPSRPGLTIAQQKSELARLLGMASRRRLNTIYLQVRPTADTFWPSKREPWSASLTGVQGRSPGWDPLAFAVKAAHRRGLTLHAWFNPYRVTTKGTKLSALAPSSPARRHPGWVVRYGNQMILNPGIPAVRKHVTRTIMEVVRRYDIDGVHLDDYFYPYPIDGERFDDTLAWKTYGDHFRRRSVWRRHNVNTFVRNLDARIHAENPTLSFGISPFGVWRNRQTNRGGSATSAGVQSYVDTFVDSRRWVKQGWVDYIEPQLYWNIGYSAADYRALVRWWSKVVRRTGVHLYIGQASYKVGTSDQSAAWTRPREMTRHLFVNRKFRPVNGDAYFDATHVRRNALRHLDLVQGDHYRRPALPPVTKGSPQRPPRHPRHLRLKRVKNGVRLTWKGRGYRFMVFRFRHRKGALVPGALRDATHLVRIVRHGRHRYLERREVSGKSFVVVGVNRAWRGSTRSRVVTMR